MPDLNRGRNTPSAARALPRRAKAAARKVTDEPQVESYRPLSLPGTLMRALAGAGLIQSHSTDEPVQYSPLEVQILRIAEALRTAGIPPRKIVTALGPIRAVLTQTYDPTVPAILDARIVNLTSAKRRDAIARKRTESEQHFASAVAVEDTDITAARTGYLKALAVHRDHLEARINLGRLLHLAGELEEAEKVYRQARHASAHLSFNLAVLLEDLDREEEAVAAYRETLALDPAFHDAHFNLSRLHDRAKRSRESLRHLLAYRRHVLRQDQT
jgi:tetratricopeptide (TPR) repeat protein